MDTFLEESADNCAAGGGHNDCAVEGSKLVEKKKRFLPTTRVERATFPLRRGCSTTKLNGLWKLVSLLEYIQRKNK